MNTCWKITMIKDGFLSMKSNQNEQGPILKVRRRSKDKNYHFAWTKNGNVLVRKDADRSIIRITTEEELYKKVKQLFPELFFLNVIH